MDAELEFAIQNNTTGKQLFDQVTDSDICFLLFLFYFTVIFGSTIRISH